MNTWNIFYRYALIAMIFWSFSIVMLLMNKSQRNKSFLLSILLGFSGVFSLIIFVINLWISLQRPPLRTLGETRLWYTIFIALLGLFLYFKWRYQWLLYFTLLMATVFMMMLWLNPDSYNKVLMPALQSIWFIPHVIVYIFAYAMLGISFVVAVWGLYSLYFKVLDEQLFDVASNVVYMGVGFLTLGLVFGALWAKEAWGHYWTWDPKETWAFLTWIIYLVYIHIHLKFNHLRKTNFWILVIAFAVLLMCWFGVNYLPIAKQSVHTYTL